MRCFLISNFQFLKTEIYLKLRSRIFRRRFSSLFVLIHLCSDSEDDDEDDEDAYEDSEDDEDYFPSSGSAGRISGFYGAGIGDYLHIIVGAFFADDAVESEDLADIRHDDGFHIDGIDLIGLDCNAIRCEILGDSCDDIIEDLFPFVLL